jgi:phosphoglycolate phosphatase
MTLILWDIDGTLVRSNGGRVAVRAFLRALEQVAQHRVELTYPLDAGGKTDRQLALEVLASSLALAQEEAMALMPAFGDAYLAELERERAQLLADLLVLPGVPDVLQELQKREVAQSLLTGNLEPIARLKLGCVGLAEYVDFEVGAFGSDHHDRTCLVPIARERVRQRIGEEIMPDEIVVVGDTPRDIACARAGGAHVVAVATGRYSREELEAHAPDAVLSDLRDTEAVLETLLRYSTSYTGHRVARADSEQREWSTMSTVPRTT